jgi:hypothetical protein
MAADDVCENLDYPNDITRTAKEAGQKAQVIQ